MEIFKTLVGQSERQKTERYIAAAFLDFQNFLDLEIRKRNQALRDAGLPVPTRQGVASYQITERSSRNFGSVPKQIAITLPSFEIPPYHSWYIRDDYWVIVTQNMEEVTRAWSAWGLGGIAQLPHTCVTAHPYVFYESFRGKTVSIHNVRGTPRDYLTQCYLLQREPQYRNPSNERHYQDYPLPARRPPLTFPEAAGMQFRALLVDNLTDYRYSQYRDRMWTEGEFASKLPNEILFNPSLQLPSLEPPINPEPYTNLKVLPAGEIRPALMSEFWQSLRPLNCSMGFELIATLDSVFFWLVVPTQHTAFVQRTLERYFPKSVVMEHPGFSLAEGKKARVSHTFTQYSYQHPIKQLRQFAVDPYTNIAHILERNAANRLACVQVLLRPIPTDSLDLLTRGASQFLKRWGVDDESIIRPLQKRWPLWVVSLNTITVTKQTREELLSQLCSAFEEGKQTVQHVKGASHTTLPRSSPHFMLLDTDELSALAHFPITPLPIPSLETTSMKAQLPPEPFRTGQVHIGEAEVRKQRVPVALPDSVRDRHLYIVGKTRMGKSTLITNIALADIDRGAGVCVIDPHGDLVEELLGNIPLNRVRDTIYFNANDKEHPIALNVLQAKNEDEVALLADNLHVTFRRLSESWGQRMDDILRATLQTLASTPGSTFVDIKKLLQDPAFRGRVTANLDHPMLRDFWQLDFANYPKDAPTPIISRVNRFLYAPHFYRMFSTTKNALSISDVVERQKILLVNLASGAIGDDNATILGSLLVSQIQQAVMRRAGLPKEARTPYYLFVDEFQNFTNSAFDKILSEAGKYKLCLTLAHQFISQLSDSQRDAIFGNVGTMFMFGVGDKDAHYLRNQIGIFEPDDLLNMPPYQALCRPATRVADTFHFKTLPPPEGRPSYAANIIEATHANYSLNSEKQKTAAQNTAPARPAESQRAEVHTPAPAQAAAEASPSGAPIAGLRPVLALPKEFGSTAEKILYYVELAEYLSTQQIIALCYGHQAENSRKANASRDLGKLVGSKQLKMQPFGSGRIYTTARLINPTLHNLAVRDLLVKILLSRYEVAGVNLKPQLPSHNPDLEVSFLAESGGLIKTFWEYDAGTEGIEVLRKKFDYYSPYAKTALVGFVFNSEARMRQVERGAALNGVGWVRLGVLGEFNSLDDPAFIIQGESSAQPFFGYF